MVYQAVTGRGPPGELHILTVWKPSVETVALRRLPKTVRGWQNYELKQAGEAAAIYSWKWWVNGGLMVGKWWFYGDLMVINGD